MKTFLDTFHTVLVCFCQHSDINKFNHLHQLIEILKPLTTQTAHREEVRPAIFDLQKNEWIDFSNLEWTSDDLAKWTNLDKDKYEFDRVNIFFPSYEKAYKNKLTPDIYIKYSGKPTPKEARYESIFMIVLKNDFIARIGKMEFENIKQKLISFLSPVFIVIKEMPWATPISEGVYTDYLQDFFPSLLLEKGNRVVLAKEYEDWTKIDV